MSENNPNKAGNVELDPQLTAQQLADLAATDPQSWAAIAEHPNVYPDLRNWVVQQLGEGFAPAPAPEAEVSAAPLFDFGPAPAPDAPAAAAESKAGSDTEVETALDAEAEKAPAPDDLPELSAPAINFAVPTVETEAEADSETKSEPKPEPEAEKTAASKAEIDAAPASKPEAASKSDTASAPDTTPAPDETPAPDFAPAPSAEIASAALLPTFEPAPLPDYPQTTVLPEYSQPNDQNQTVALPQTGVAPYLQQQNTAQPQQSAPESVTPQQFIQQEKPEKKSRAVPILASILVFLLVVSAAGWGLFFTKTWPFNADGPLSHLAGHEKPQVKKATSNSDNQNSGKKRASDVPESIGIDCPGSTILLAWSELPDGWILVCGINMETPSFFAYKSGDKTIKSIASQDPTSTPAQQAIKWDEKARRYLASLEDGNKAVLDYKLGTFTVRDASGEKTPVAGSSCALCV
ncbi:MAG: hypothetical protein Q4C71_00525 [Microbacteriaceae bacterium]|nr:hypothetical protein [Microbacteriaceae bacterium]